MSQPVDLGPCTGHWLNTFADTQWIRQFELIVDDSSSWWIDILAATEQPHWGRQRLTTYVDNIGEKGFRAEYHLADCNVTLAANTNHHLIVITGFIDYRDAPQDNYLCREFFYQETKP